MSEVVVRLTIDQTSDMDRLMDALDAFALWCESHAETEADEIPGEFMMTTEHTGESLSRKLIFSNQDHASQFLIFWRNQGFRPSAIAS